MLLEGSVGARLQVTNQLPQVVFTARVLCVTLVHHNTSYPRADSKPCSVPMEGKTLVNML